MNPAEYARMADLEATHWWYVGLRDLFTRLLKSPHFKLPANPSVLDAGCGTGANLKLLSDVLKPTYIGGFDLSPLAVDHARRLNPEADVYVGDLCAPEVHVSSLDLILCCDVLYATPLEDALRGLEQLIHRLPSGGLLLLHLPAYDWLKSRHDLAVHTRQRFTVSSVRQMLLRLGLQVELLSYRMSLLLPAVVLRRLPSLFSRPKTEADRVQSDLRPANTATNRLLTAVIRMENEGLGRGCRFPCGSSIVAVGRKP